MLLAELQNRSAQIDTGEVTLIPWSEVQAPSTCRLEGKDSG